MLKRPAVRRVLAQLAQLAVDFGILSRVDMNRINELSARKCQFRRVVPTFPIDFM
jgi:hypothetical protein